MFLNAVLAIWRGVDLNSIWHFSEGFRGGAGEQWQDAFHPTDGFSAVEHVHPDCRAVRRRSAGADAVLRRALSGHGVRPVDLPGEPARHRNLLVGAGLETLFHGLASAIRCGARRWPMPTRRATGAFTRSWPRD